MKKRKYDKNNVGERGITLITLVITIILLIILASISINLLLGDFGMLKKTQEASEEYKIESIRERLELIKAPVQVEKYIVTIDDYFKQLEKENIPYTVTDIDRIDEENAYITVDDEYEFLLEHEDSGNLKITYQGKVKQSKPRIDDIEVTKGSNNITVTVDAERAESYNFYIKEGEQGSYELKESQNTTGIYEFTNLNLDTTYYIKVEAVNKNGSVQKEIEEKRETSQMQEANITISGDKTLTALPASLTATITHVIPESGIDINSCKYVLNNSNQPIGTDASNYTDGNFTSNDEQISLSLNSVTTWYLHVLTVSNSGQAKETIKGPITVTANKHAHSGSSNVAGGCYKVTSTTKCTGTIIVYGASNASCDRCGKGYSNPGYSAGLTLGNCTNYIENISLGCGKTAGTTIDSYSVSY